MFDLVWIVHPIDWGGFSAWYSLGYNAITREPGPRGSFTTSTVIKAAYHFFLGGRDESSLVCWEKPFVFFLFFEISRFLETSSWDLGRLWRFGPSFCMWKKDPVLMYQKGAGGIWPKIRGPMWRAWVVLPNPCGYDEDIPPMLWLFLAKSRNYWVFTRDGGQLKLKHFFGIFIPIFFGGNSLQFWRLRIFSHGVVQLNHQPEESLLPSKWFNF